MGPPRFPALRAPAAGRFCYHGRVRASYPAAGCLWILLGGLCRGGPVPAFVDVTESAGIRFVHTGGSRAKDYILEVNGSGVALFDYDGDGDLDIYFANGSAMELPPGAPPPR